MLEIKKTPQGQVWLCGVLFLGGVGCSMVILGFPRCFSGF